MVKPVHVKIGREHTKVMMSKTTDLVGHCLAALGELQRRNRFRRVVVRRGDVNEHESFGVAACCGVVAAKLISTKAEEASDGGTTTRGLVSCPALSAQQQG
jgi:hypothetical protein